jgi:hypothetical protein
VPGESVAYHAQQNHFSNWLMARTEFELAPPACNRRKSAISKAWRAMRNHLIQSLAEYREKNQTGVITDFTPSKFDVANSFTRIGGGSIGGKARGLAFYQCDHSPPQSPPPL